MAERQYFCFWNVFRFYASSIATYNNFKGVLQMKKRYCSILLIVLAIALLTACGSADNASEPLPTPVEAAPVPESADFAFEEAETAEDMLFNFRAETGGDRSRETDSAYFNFPTLTPDEAGDRRLIYNVSMRLQTMDFLPRMQLLLDTVADAGGYLVHANVHGYDLNQNRTAQSAGFIFRVPTEGLGELIRVVQGNFSIISLNQNMQEATAQYQQTEWNLDDLREQEAALLEILENADEEDDEELIATTEAELRAVRGAIRELEASQAAITSDVIYSTVEVQLFEVLPPQETLGFGAIMARIGIGVLVFVAIIVVIVLVVKKNAKPAQGS